jgi:hypothetical protein
VDRDYDVRPGRLDTPCWIIRKVPASGGYAQIRVNGKHRMAHWVSYEKHVGLVTDETLDHLCETPLCINPAHLEPCSRAENTLRGDTVTAANKAKTHCNRGHELAGHNLIIGNNKGRPSRACRACAGLTRSRKRAAERAPHLVARAHLAAHIREARMLGEPFRTIAELYGVSKSQVQRICKEGAWAL